jgi:apolipoprotein N-acyltransferase
MNSAAIPLPAWARTTLPIALLGSILIWAALPPIALGWLGWIAPVPWLLLVRMDLLPGRQPYRRLYFAGLIFWLLAIHWLRLPHPAVIPLWLLLCAYLAFYLPVFVALSRVAVHRLRLPLWLAAPVVWTGLELARAHLLTGFLMGSLAHSQVNWIQLIQVGDIVGEYGVDFLVMLVAACIAIVVPLGANAKQQPIVRRLAAMIPAALVLAAALSYGHMRLAEAFPTDAANAQTGPRIALIQGNSLADWKLDTDRQRQIMDEYVGLSEKAIAEAKITGDGRLPNLVVWPETMYRNPLRGFDPGFQLPTGVKTTTDEIVAADRRELTNLATHLGVPILVGIDRLQFRVGSDAPADRPAFRAYNTAALATPNGQTVTTYDKVHLVMFGEYVPFSHYIPVLERLSSLTGSVEAGEGPVALCTPRDCYIPSICYETAIPHVIRRQVATLETDSQRPVALVNLTNDAWYWGSSELDMHLACGVFRAVESRLPLVIAANGGTSAWIDHVGRVRAKSPKQQPTFIIADIERSQMQSLYVRYGDWFSDLCLIGCIIFAAVGWKSRRDLRKVIETKT